MSLPPQFLVNNPLDVLFRPGVHADMFTRFKLGRSLDEVSTYGCDLLLSELALAVCVQEGIDQRLNHLDTPRFARSGEAAPESDEHGIIITHGSAKDHRPDLNQAVLELMVSQDGGVPLLRQSWDGHASDTKVLQARAQTLMTTLKDAPSPRYVVAACQLSQKDQAEHWQALPFITRIPTTRKVVSQVMTPALAIDTWHDVDEQRRYQCLEFCHLGIEQRWLVVYAEAAAWRAESSLRRAQQKAYAAIAKHLCHWPASRFDTPAAAHAALPPVAKTWKYHQVDSYELIEHKRYAHKGRPRADTPCQAIAWPIQARVRPDAERMGYATQLGACSVLGTNIEAAQLSDVAVMGGDKGQAKAEGGFRFLKDPLFFVSSLCVKKPCRMQGLLMVMTLALLVYAVAQRRRRHAFARQNATIPHQINQPTSRPTLRWVLQMLEGIERVRMMVDGKVRALITGLNEVRIAILRFFGEQVCLVYQVPSG